MLWAVFPMKKCDTTKGLKKKKRFTDCSLLWRMKHQQGLLGSEEAGSDDGLECDSEWKTQESCLIPRFLA